MIQEVWLPNQMEADLFLPVSSHNNNNVGSAVSAVQVNAHYRAYARGLVLLARNKAVAKRIQNLTVTIDCLCEGFFEPSSSTLLKHSLWNRKKTKRIPVCQILVKGIQTAKSNTVGTISLVSIINVPPTTTTTVVLPSRHYRQQMKANGTSILGNAEDAKSFRGEPLCMSVVQLEFDIVGRCGKSQHHELVTIPALPRLQIILEREQRFAREIITSDAFSCDFSCTTNPQHPVADMPAAYLCQEAQFDGLTFHVTPAVMIPRPGSEAVVQRAVESFCWEKSVPLDQVRVLDLGTGSGCLLLSILQRLPGAVGVGLDLSKDALAVAQQNALKLGITSRCRFLQGTFDNLENVLVDSGYEVMNGAFDIVVCNPPYHIKRKGGRRQLDAATLQHEPPMALFVQEDNDVTTNGFDNDFVRHYRSVLNSLRRWSLVRKGTVLIFEVFKGNAQHVFKLMKDAYQLEKVAIGRDNKGCIRTVEGSYN